MAVVDFARAHRLFALGLALCAAACSSPTGPVPRDAVGTSGALSGPSAVVETVNDERDDAGLPDLRVDARLAEAARIHAEQLARAGRLEHTLRGVRYPTVADRLAAVEYRWRAYGENLASGQRSAASAVAGWMSSRSHRANILNAAFTETGVAVATDARGRPYWVQVFARR